MNPPPRRQPQLPTSTTALTNVGEDTRALLHYQAHCKSAGLAFALCFFLGPLGAHRFYAGKTGSAVTMLVISLVSFPLCFFLIGFVGVFVVLIWVLMDAFSVTDWIRDHNSRLAHSLAR